MKYKILGLSMIVWLLGAYSPYSSLAAPLNSGKIAAPGPLVYDWQNINIQGGKVSHTFTLANTGKDNLVLIGAYTSCMCTTAIIELADGSQSPLYSMRNNPTNWIKTVRPGEPFSVYVEFDPMAHGPEHTGPIRRSVYLISSAPVDGIFTFPLRNLPNVSAVKMTLSGEVLSEEAYKQTQKTDYAVKTGGFEFFEKETDLGVVKQSQGIVSHEFPFRYNGPTPITVKSLPTSCACTTASIDKKDLKPGDEGVITVEFDPNLHAEPGDKFFRTIYLQTEPKLKEEVELKIWVEIDTDLGSQAYKIKSQKH
ncbi:MAG: DUF1573 domain-containing protein [Planctomycetota bacterium]|jgi:hypothetical protein